MKRIVHPGLMSRGSWIRSSAFGRFGAENRLQRRNYEPDNLVANPSIKFLGLQGPYLLPGGIYRHALAAQAEQPEQHGGSVSRLRATGTTRRCIGCSRQEPRVHSLNAPMAGPHQTW